jgi:hypothetical protein
MYVSLTYNFKHKYLIPGVDVMITIFGDFRPFSTKYWLFILKTNVIIQFLQK